MLAALAEEVADDPVADLLDEIRTHTEVLPALVALLAGPAATTAAVADTTVIRPGTGALSAAAGFFAA